jgi:hypothetical protein
MRFFQLTSQVRLAVGDPSEREEAILKVTRQKGTVLQVFDRLSLGVQHPLYSLDDFIAMGQEELEELDMCSKRHLARTRSGWPLFRRKERMKSQASRRYRALYVTHRVLIVTGKSIRVRRAGDPCRNGACE